MYMIKCIYKVRVHIKYEGGYIMKKSNLIKRLEKERYIITYEKVGYWDNIPVVKIDNNSFFDNIIELV